MKRQHKTLGIGNLLATVALVSVGCGASQASHETPADATNHSAHERQAEMMTEGSPAMCPLRIEGTSARYEEASGGAALTFVTTGDVAEVRRRVAHMATMHSQHHAHGAEQGHGKMHAAKHGGGMKMGPATARSEDIDAGARLILTPRDPANIEKVRMHTKHMAEMMSNGECPMMHKTKTSPKSASDDVDIPI